MAETTSTEPSPEVPRTARSFLRAHRVGSALAVVAVVLVGCLVFSVVYVNTYQPLAEGPWGYGPAGALKTVGDGIFETNTILTGRRGLTGELGFSITNDGWRSVSLSGLNDASSIAPWLLTIGWVPVGDDPKRPVPPIATERRFPAPVDPGQTIMVYATFRKPICHSNGELWSVSSINLEWEAFGENHTYTEPLAQSAFGPLPVYLCFPTAALKHIVSF